MTEYLISSFAWGLFWLAVGYVLGRIHAHRIRKKSE